MNGYSRSPPLACVRTAWYMPYYVFTDFAYILRTKWVKYPESRSNHEHFAEESSLQPPNQKWYLQKKCQLLTTSMVLIGSEGWWWQNSGLKITRAIARFPIIASHRMHRSSAARCALRAIQSRINHLQLRFISFIQYSMCAFATNLRSFVAISFTTSKE